jgi:hypothetical protein
MNAIDPRRGRHAPSLDVGAREPIGACRRTDLPSAARPDRPRAQDGKAGRIVARRHAADARRTGALRRHLPPWRALVRLATGGSAGWYCAWTAGGWSSPDPVPLFALFMENAAALSAVARPPGPKCWIGRALHWARRSSRAGSADRGTIASPLALCRAPGSRQSERAEACRRGRSRPSRTPAPFAALPRGCWRARGAGVRGISGKRRAGIAAS